MLDVSGYLRDNRAKLVDRAGHRLAAGEGLRLSVESVMERFFDGLAEAVESGSSEWLSPLVKEWVEARSAPAGVEQATVLPVLQTLKNVTWQALQEDCDPAEALAAVVALEPIFDGALLELVALEAEAAVAEVVTELTATQDDLEKLDRSKSSFISIAAHELKTPMTLVEGYAKMIAAELAEEEFQHVHVLVKGISNGTRRLREIVDDMVDVSLIDNQMLSLTYQPVWLYRLMDIVETDLEDVLTQRRQQFIVTDFDDTGRPTLADPERLYQVFRNVIINAVKFTPDGGKITISARPLPGFVEVTVTDSGIGVAPENQQRIFEKFAGLGDASLHSSGKSKFKGGGAGLGLAIARGIIEAHGGTIWCESLGYNEKTFPGATFHIMVPMRTELPKNSISKLYGLTQEEIELISNSKDERKK